MVSAPVQALSEQDLRNCDSLQAEVSIPACTSVINEPQLPDSKRALARLKRGLAYYSMLKFDEALPDFDAARKLDPKDHIAHNNLGLVHTVKGDYAKAVTAFDEGIRVNPESADLFYNRGFAYAMLKEFDKAIVDMKEAIKLGPSGRTGVIEKEGQVDRADAAQMLAGYYNALASVYGLMGEHDKAIATHDEAVAKFPKASVVYLNRAEAYMTKGDAKLALADLDWAIALDGETAPVLGMRALLNFEIGEFAAAAVDFRSAWALDPEQTMVPKAYVPIWVQLTLARSDAKAARQALVEMQAKVDQTEWPAPIARMLLGEITVAALLQAATSNDEACEAHFYIGQYHLQRREQAPGIAAMKKALETCPETFFEYRGAKAELARGG
jgi:tetratricopeptide (TPR) repeat protein